MTVGAHAVVWGSAMSGCQFWVLVGAPVYSQSVKQPTGVTDRRKIQLITGFTGKLEVYREKESQKWYLRGQPCTGQSTQ